MFRTTEWFAALVSTDPPLSLSPFSQLWEKEAGGLQFLSQVWEKYLGRGPIVGKFTPNGTRWN